jgi:DMSO/TMAO reductase YedYZ heme-binding membrane subunit
MQLLALLAAVWKAWHRVSFHEENQQVSVGEQGVNKVSRTPRIIE